MATLAELLAERERRRKRAAEREAARAAKEAEEKWAAARAAVDPANLSAGELANMIDGLTPDGHDKRGRKVSFVETGRPARRGLSDGLRGLY